MPLVPLCTIAALPVPGELKAFTVAGREVCVANDGGTYAAIDNICPHQGGPLNEGTLEDGAVVCPWHTWAFSLQTGELVEGGDQGVAVFALQMEGETALIQIDGQQNG